VRGTEMRAMTMKRINMILAIVDADVVYHLTYYVMQYFPMNA
jgi:hypothetical protein